MSANQPYGGQSVEVAVLKFSEVGIARDYNSGPAAQGLVSDVRQRSLCVVGIQIALGNVSDVNTKPPNIEDAVP